MNFKRMKIIDEWLCQDQNIPDFNILKKVFKESGIYKITIKEAGGCGMGSYPSTITIEKVEE